MRLPGVPLRAFGRSLVMRRGGSEEQDNRTKGKGKTMSATTTIDSKTTNTARRSPSPSPEAHQRAGVQGQTRIVVMNGSRIEMRHDGRQWWNVKVTAA